MNTSIDTPIPNRIRAKRAPRPGTWIAAVIVALFSVWLIAFAAGNEVFEWNVVGTYLFDVKVIKGVGWTLLLTLVSMIIGTVIALTAAIMRLSSNPVLRGVSWAYIFVFRGVPVYTQLVFWGLITVIIPKVVIGVPFGPRREISLPRSGQPRSHSVSTKAPTSRKSCARASRASSVAKTRPRNLSA